MLDESRARHIQTLAGIAGDYLSAMRETIQAMQESRIAAPPCN